MLSRLWKPSYLISSDCIHALVMHQRIFVATGTWLFPFRSEADHVCGTDYIVWTRKSFQPHPTVFEALIYLNRPLVEHSLSESRRRFLPRIVIFWVLGQWSSQNASRTLEVIRVLVSLVCISLIISDLPCFNIKKISVQRSLRMGRISYHAPLSVLHKQHAQPSQ